MKPSKAQRVFFRIRFAAGKSLAPRAVDFLRRGKWMIPAIAISIALHAIFLASNPGKVFNMPERYGASISTYGSRDASLYAKMADQMLSRHIYGYNSDSPNAYVTPGLPLYLAASFAAGDALHLPRLRVAQVLNALLSVSTVLIIFLITAKVSESNAVALCSSLLYACYFSPLHYFRTTLTEVPGIFLAYLSLYLYICALGSARVRMQAAFSLCFCLAVMVRPTPAPLIFIAAIPVLYRYSGRDCLRIFGMWAAAALLIFGPWFLRNYLVFDRLMFTSHGGNPLLAGANPFFESPFSEIMEQVRVSGLSQADLAIQKIKLGFEDHADLWLAWFTVGKTYWLFRVPSAWAGYLPAFSPFSGFVYGLHYFILICSGICIITPATEGKRIVKVSVLAYIILSLLFLPNDRYGFFAIPGLTILAGLGLLHTLVKIKEFGLMAALRVREAAGLK